MDTAADQAPSFTHKTIIKVRDLRIFYRDFEAVRGVSLSMKKGAIAALVGPNGAGKTSLINGIIGLQPRHSGQIELDGITLRQGPRQLAGRIGYLPDRIGLFEELPARQALYYFAAAQQMTPEQTQKRIDELETLCRLEGLLHLRARQMSRGQRQALAIAQAMINAPPLLFLDEPASGLDPDARLNLSRVLTELGRGGTTIMVSSHILNELEDYATQILIMDKGELVENRDLSTSANDIIEINISLDPTEAQTATAEQAFGHFPMIESAEAQESPGFFLLRLHSAGDPNKAIRECLAALVGAGLPVIHFARRTERLSSVYAARMKAKDTQS